jgi:2-polyprenyl-6-methoxyphenol hydroxylase-like FAD-dependent oxidoreductase
MTPAHDPDPAGIAAPEVAIVGAGPDGLLLACELAIADVRTVVLERATDPSRPATEPGPLGQAARMVDHRGLAERLTATPLPATAALGTVLAERAAGLGVEVRRGHELLDLEQDESAVTATIAGPDGPYRLRVEFLVGADGARSATRERAGIAFPAVTPGDGSHRIAERLRERRVFLIGEAAHASGTAGATDLDLGLADAFNLGWKLAAAILGDAGPDLLDSYERERRPALAQRADLPYDMGGDSGALVGRLAPEMTLRTLGGSVRLAELTTRALPLLVDRTEDGSLATAIAPWHEDVDVVRAHPDAAECATTALFLRPDCHVAWTSTSSRPTPAERDALRGAAERWLGPREG